MAAPSLISVFTRLPEPGTSKTRLIPLLGPEGAAVLQREMTELVVRQAQTLWATGEADVEARVTGGDPHRARRWLGVPCVLQGEGDLGERMEAALAEGARRDAVAAVIGGDCPTVSASDLRLLLSAAAEQGASIIPAADGGFCALALRPDASARVRGLFHGIEWSTERVCTETVSALRRLGTDVAELGTRRDIDRPEDLPEWEAVRHSWLERPESLTVVVPVLNEAPHLPAIVSALHAEGVDLIVADGGSTDGSARIAEEAGAVVLGGPAGRGRQLNAGARAARSDALLFLHADTRLPDGFSRLVLDALQDPTVALGAFTFATDSVSPAMRLIEAGTRLRTRLLALPYGDQALFCRRAMFEALGGFPEMPVMEDYELVRRARRVGRIALLHEPAVTSERRWREHGIWRWTALNLATVARYHLGTPAEELAAWRRGYSKR